MRQTIRQQTAIRSPLASQAGRTLPRQPVAPMSFLVDGTDDTLIYICPRTTRQAFGHYTSDPAPKRITFLADHRANLIGVIVAIAILSAFALT